MKNFQKVKQSKKFRRKVRVRAKVFGTETKPRLVVFRGLKNIHAQLINDDNGQVAAAAYSRELKDKKSNKTDIAKKVGLLIAEKAAVKKIKKVVFDRASNKYHGRIKALADGARAGGLKF